ncbi:protein kinase domain-containing protein [Litorisediminicola beolgyonensis]|uniref:Protein kinase n=1 Tax=Litorisediminicola beolgyonensis TaxID=1173614 RepID=A0ABW3ZK85_9RHOB
MPKDSRGVTELAVSIGQFSSAGAKPLNQDFHGAMVPTGAELRLKGIALAVADGISTSAVSGEAAETAVKSLLTDYYATPDSWSVRSAASRVIAATNAWLHGQNTSVGDINAGRVTTLAALILKGREAHVFNVGDSRVTRLVGTALEPLTQDHRVTLSATESYLGRALGAAPDLEIDCRRVPLAQGDVFLLTTDGIHEHVDGRDVARALAEADLDSAARSLAETALARGSGDNLTVQILRVDGLPESMEFVPDLAERPAPSLPGAGDRLDGFRIIRQVHASARSHVFLAEAPDGARVAIKIPGSDILGDPAARRRFAMEEWVARRAASPHLLSAADAPADRTSFYAVSAWIDGVSLRQWMTDHPRPTLDQVRDIVSQTAAGLRALHRREMIHQDLRPENILIDRDGTLRIVDLGSVRVAGVEEAAPGLLGEMPGTFQYTAPEYLSGDIVSWRSDQYALGVIAYEMLTGRLPYGAEVARIQSRADQRRLRYRSARDDTSGVPDWIDTALRRAVHPDPLRRYDALSELTADLARPGAGYRAARHVPLAERNPERFWQTVSAILAVICFVVLSRTGG